MMDRAQAEAQGGKRFKVAVIQVRADLYTVYAKDGQEASKLVLGDQSAFQQRMGRPAGFEGPEVMSVFAREMDIGTPEIPFLQMFASMMRQPQANVQVPKLVMP